MIHASVDQPRHGAEATARRRAGAPLWVLLLGIGLILLAVAPLRTTPARAVDATPGPSSPASTASPTPLASAAGD